MKISKTPFTEKETFSILEDYTDKAKAYKEGREAGNK